MIISISKHTQKKKKHLNFKLQYVFEPVLVVYDVRSKTEV